MIQIEVKTTKAEVQRFLTKLSEILNDDSFDVSKHLIFIQNSKNMQTLMDLDYDTQQIVEHLKTLTITEFSEVKIDNENAYPPYLWVFGRYIERHLVYIKLKIREKEDSTKVVCLSFHIAVHPMSFPYKKR